MKALLLAVTLANPILFVTQVPVPGDFTTVASTFGNHPASAAEAPRGREAFSHERRRLRPWWPLSVGLCIAEPRSTTSGFSEGHGP